MQVILIYFSVFETEAVSIKHEFIQGLWSSSMVKHFVCFRALCVVLSNQPL